MGEDNGNGICFFIGVTLGILLTMIVWWFTDTFEVIAK